MARRKKATARPPPRDCALVIPEPLLELYNRASLFLDKKSTHQDHYWAVGIHKAIHASFPECGETHADMTKPPGRLSGSKVSPQTPQAYPCQRSTVKHRASKERRRPKSGPEQLAFKLTHEDRPDCRGHDVNNAVRFEDFKKLCLWRWANVWSWFVQSGQNRIKCRSKAAPGERLAMSAVQSRWSGSYHITGPLCGTAFYRMNTANTSRRS